MQGLSNFSDNELFVLLQSGNGNAYCEIYDRFSLILLNHAYNKTRDREEAKDIVHEVFANLWANHAGLDLTKTLSGYLFTCVRNAFLDQRRHKLVEDKFLESIRAFSLSDRVVTDHLVRERLFAEMVEQEINALPPRTAEVFKLSRNAYLSHKQIAERLNISEQTVSKHITNAIKVLRVKLGILLYLLWLFAR